MADPNKLPLRIRKDVRDTFMSDGSDLTKAIHAVSEVIGYPVQITGPDWGVLWASLFSFHNEARGQEVFVPAVSNLATAWFEVLATKLDEGEATGWNEQLLTAIEPARKVELFVETLRESQYDHVKKGNPQVPVSVFDPARTAFIMLLPNKKLEATVQQQLLSARDRFKKDLDTAFDPNVVSQPGSTADQAYVVVAPPEPFLATGSDPTRHQIASETHGPSSIGSDAFPTLASLARPELLFRSTLPYILTMTSPVNTSIHISASHHPSLRLILAYIEKHARDHPQRTDKSKMIEVDPVISDLARPFSSPQYSGIVVRSQAWTYKTGKSAGVNGAWLMTFIEGVLGYKFVHQADGAWVFRRDRRFADEGIDAFNE